MLRLAKDTRYRRKFSFVFDMLTGRKPKKTSITRIVTVPSFLMFTRKYLCKVKAVYKKSMSTLPQKMWGGGTMGNVSASFMCPDSRQKILKGMDMFYRKRYN